MLLKSQPTPALLESLVFFSYKHWCGKLLRGTNVKQLNARSKLTCMDNDTDSMTIGNHTLLSNYLVQVHAWILRIPYCVLFDLALFDQQNTNERRFHSCSFMFLLFKNISVLDSRDYRIQTRQKSLEHFTGEVISRYLAAEINIAWADNLCGSPQCEEVQHIAVARRQVIFLTVTGDHWLSLREKEQPP